MMPCRGLRGAPPRRPLDIGHAGGPAMRAIARRRGDASRALDCRRVLLGAPGDRGARSAAAQSSLDPLNACRAAGGQASPRRPRLPPPPGRAVPCFRCPTAAAAPVLCRRLATMSSQLVWELVKKNHAFLRKARRQMGVLLERVAAPQAASCVRSAVARAGVAACRLCWRHSRCTAAAASSLPSSSHHPHPQNTRLHRTVVGEPHRVLGRARQPGQPPLLQVQRPGQPRLHAGHCGEGRRRGDCQEQQEEQGGRAQGQRVQEERAPHQHGRRQGGGVCAPRPQGACGWRALGGVGCKWTAGEGRPARAGCVCVFVHSRPRRRDEL